MSFQTIKNLNSYEYNATGNDKEYLKIINSIRHCRINKNINRVIVENTGSKPSKLDYIFAGNGRYYPVVKCTNNHVYIIEVGFKNLTILREGFWSCDLEELCDSLRKTFSFLGL